MPLPLLFVDRVCEHCQRSFRLDARIAKRPGGRYGRFCSVACNSRWHAAKRSARAFRRRLAACAHCGGFFTARPWEVRKGLSRFCSTSCAGKAAYAQGIGIAAMTPEERRIAGSRGARSGHERGTAFAPMADPAIAAHMRAEAALAITLLPWPRLGHTRAAQSAHEQVYRAVRSGALKRLPCERCGATHCVHGHHEDYSRPLDVRWLCPKCHARHHLSIGGAA